MDIKDFYEDNNKKLPSYQRPVCGVVKTSDGVYQLLNHKGNIIWDSSNTQKNISTALSEKSKQYYKDIGEIPEQRIWILGIKETGDTDWKYKNVASCCRESFNGEINGHIIQIIKKGEREKDKKYFELLKENGKIAFFEILIKEYVEKFNSQISQDKYLSSIIFPTEQIKDSNICKIYNKNLMYFVEGHLAAKHRMKFGNPKEVLWFPSGSGIDGDIYQYFISKINDVDKV